MFCENCGNNLSAKTKFCGSCGHKVSDNKDIASSSENAAKATEDTARQTQANEADVRSAQLEADTPKPDAEIISKTSVQPTPIADKIETAQSTKSTEEHVSSSDRVSYVLNPNATATDYDKTSFSDIIQGGQAIIGGIVLLIIAVGGITTFLNTRVAPPDSSVAATTEAEARLAEAAAKRLEAEKADSPEVLAAFQTAKESRQISKLGVFVQSYPESENADEAKRLATASLNRQNSNLARKTYLRYFGELPEGQSIQEETSSAPTSDTSNEFSSKELQALLGNFNEPRLPDKEEEEDKVLGEISYEGPRDFDGEPHGIGKMTFEGGAVYEGRFEHGDLTVGETRFKDGSTYTGGYNGPHPHGEGILKTAEGTVYTGTFVNSDFHGQGVMEFADGSKYEGEFGDDSYNGKGKFSFPDGSFMSGDFTDGFLNGQGLQVSSAGRYTGAFSNDEFHGYGTLNLSTGDYYEGNFAEGIFSGKGKLVIKGNRTYEGDFLDGEPNGFGVTAHEDGTVYTGECKAGLAHGTGVYDSPETTDIIYGAFYEGELLSHTCKIREAGTDTECEYEVTTPC